jgi:hypothetical protein
MVALAVPAAIAAGLLSAPAASALPATPGAVVQPTSAIVAPVALPTAQLNGVAWTQVIVRTTVYVGGSFTYARPAGQAVSSKSSVRRYNILSYNLVTGALSTFAPVLNGQVRALSVSPDGSRLYVGGEFTTVNGASHQRVAEFSTITGKLVTTFHPTVNGNVMALAATNTGVYIGGAFTEVNRAKRYRLALLGRDKAVLTNFAPEANAVVAALLVTPNHTKLIVGGSFTQINHKTASGLAAVTLGVGAKLPFAVGSIVKLGTRYSGITSLTTDGTSIYGTGYVYHATVRNLEGMFSANQNTGAINWLEDCHGDTYSAYPGSAAVYVVGHAHDCARIGAFPQNGTAYHRALAFTKTATGHLATNQATGYANFGGTPSPSLLNWFPDLTPGTYTGQGQAAWSVVGNGTYLALGGEFTAVNGMPQQGLTRFALLPVATKTMPAAQATALLPMVSGNEITPSMAYTTQTASDGTVTASATLSWKADWARNTQCFTYTLVRYDDNVDSRTATTVYTVAGTSQFWNRPQLTFTDRNLAAADHYRYRLTVTAASGSVMSPSIAAPPSTSSTPSSAK